MTSNEPNDGYPVLLEDWIRRDGLKCLTVKLCGNDPEWDFGRLLKVGLLVVANGVDWLSADFNCTVTNPAYVNADPPCPSEPPPGFEVRPPLRRMSSGHSPPTTWNKEAASMNWTSESPRWRFRKERLAATRPGPRER